MEHKRIRLVDFRWIFQVDAIVIVGAVMSFGMVAFYGFDMREDNALLMLFVIFPMAMATAVSTFVTMKSVRKKWTDC